LPVSKWILLTIIPLPFSIFASVIFLSFSSFDTISFSGRCSAASAVISTSFISGISIIWSGLFTGILFEYITFPLSHFFTSTVPLTGVPSLLFIVMLSFFIGIVSGFSFLTSDSLFILFSLSTSDCFISSFSETRLYGS